MAAGRELSVDVVTPEKTVYSDTGVLYVSAPATMGRIGVLPGHMPLVSTLDPGELRIDEDGGRSIRMTIFSGFIQIHDDRVIVLTEEAREIS